MAVTESNYTVSNSSTTNYSFTFPYLKTTDVKLSINGVASSAFTFANATTIQLNSNPTVGDKLRIYRDTDDSKLEAEFFAGSAIKSSDLNDNFNQNLYVTQESNNKIDAAWTSGDETIDNTETWASNNTRIATTGAIDGRVDSKVNTAITTKVVGGDRVTATASGGDTVTLKVTPASLVDSDVNASAAIAGTKVDPQFGTQNVSLTGNITVSGTVDGRDVSADGSKLDGIETGATADQTAAEIRSLVESASDSHVFTTADHTKLDGIETAATGDQTNAEIRAAVEAASDSNVFTDADHSKLNAIEASATADQTVGEIKSLIAGSPLDASHLAANSVGDSEIATGALDNRYYTETELNAGQLDNRYYTETESDARYFNVSTGDTIKDGDTFPDNDTTIATTAAINDRIIDLVDDVGGFVPIANETSFPNANPDVNNGAGTLISIKALSSNLTSNGSGVATIANGTVGNSTVTITGLANSTTYSSAYGMIVETTTTLNTYTFHRQVPIATEVTTVASNISNVNAVGNNTTNINTVAGNTTNINTVAGANSNITSVAGSISNVNTVATNISNVNDFSDKYRVASSAPTSSLDTGDLYFDTSANELKVYNGSSWQGGVTATGNLAGLGANTFTGNQSLGDDIKIQLGASNDIQIYHNSSQPNSYIKNTATGSFYITTAGGGNLVLQTASSDNAVKCVHNAATELYYDGSKKFETTSSGIEVTGDIFGSGKLDLPDNGYLKLGTGDDLLIHHGGTASYIENTTGFLFLHSDSLALRSSNQENYIVAYKDGAVDLYYNNSKKFETITSGVRISGDLELLDNTGSTGRLLLGNGADLQIYHDGTHNYLKSTYGNIRVQNNSSNYKGFQVEANIVDFYNSANTEAKLRLHNDGAAELYYDGVKKLETTSSGVYVSGGTDISMSSTTAGQLRIVGNGYTGGIALDGSDMNIYHNSASRGIVFGTNETERVRIDTVGNLDIRNDTGKIRLGTSQDLQIYHNGSNSHIRNTTGGLVIDNSGTGDLLIQAKQGENSLYAIPDGAVNLYYDNSKKFETTSGGAKVTGTLEVTEDFVTTMANGYDFWIDRSASKIRVGDGIQFQYGNAGDLQIYHDGSNSIIKNTTGDLIFEDTGGNLIFRPKTGEDAIKAYADGSVELYYDNSKKLETNSQGIKVSNSSWATVDIIAAANDATIRLENQAGPDHEWTIRNDYSENNDLDIRYNNVRKMNLDSSGNLFIAGHFDVSDNDKLLLGNSDDLQIYHNGTNSLIKNTTGYLLIENMSTSQPLYIQSGSRIVMQPSGGGDVLFEATKDGNVELYYDNSKKLETTSSGVNVTGDLTVNGSALSSGLSELDIWIATTTRLDISGTGSDHVYSGFSRFSPSSPATWAKTGTGVSVNSTGWSFPSTGQWEVTAHITGKNFNATSNRGEWGWQFTHNNGSNWTYHQLIEVGGTSTSQVYLHTQVSTMFSITDTSNQKIRFSMQFSGNNGGSNFNVMGDSTTLKTYYIFKKLA